MQVNIDLERAVREVVAEVLQGPGGDQMLVAALEKAPVPEHVWNKLDEESVRNRVLELIRTRLPDQDECRDMARDEIRDNLDLDTGIEDYLNENCPDLEDRVSCHIDDNCPDLDDSVSEFLETCLKPSVIARTNAWFDGSPLEDLVYAALRERLDSIIQEKVDLAREHVKNDVYHRVRTELLERLDHEMKRSWFARFLDWIGL